MKILNTPLEMKNFRKTVDKTVGFVPTMGALHQGHAELLKRAREENSVLGLSIFVNPTQFNDPKDLTNYPRTWESDLALAEKMKVDFIFAPTFESMYPDNYRYKVSENQTSLLYCGKDRPGHFDGVLTVVMKLLNCVEPTKTYFGE
ncbi:MAG: pantoate--beta-alanine ligase, partial [Pseudobdellovibrionaceae bacterium]